MCRKKKNSKTVSWEFWYSDTVHSVCYLWGVNQRTSPSQPTVKPSLEDDCQGIKSDRVVRGPTSEHYNLYLMKSLSCLSLTNLSAEIDFFFLIHTALGTEGIASIFTVTWDILFCWEECHCVFLPHRPVLTVISAQLELRTAYPRRR